MCNACKVTSYPDCMRVCPIGKKIYDVIGGSVIGSLFVCKCKGEIKT